MAGISEEDIQRVRDATDIVSLFAERVPLRQRGRDFWCCCPFHNEKTPSCKVDPTTQLWHCFGCGEGGDAFGFIMKADDASFPDAVRYLAQRANIEIADSGPQVPSSLKSRLKEACTATADFYHSQLMRGKSQDAANARSYLASRGLGGSVPKTWNLGYAPGNQTLVRHLSSLGFSNDDMLEANVAMAGKDGRLRDRFFNRIMFPIFDAQGDCIAFGGRVIGKGEPKYLNSQETPLFHKSRVLYGLDKAKSQLTSTGIAIIVEGYTDVIALHEAGIQNAVATLGTALTIQHIRLISRYASKKIVYLFDGDAAGQRAADRALEFIDESMTPEAGRSRIELAAVTLPDDLDPAEFVAARGADDLKSLINEAQPLIAYGIERRLASYDLSSAEGRTCALSSALAILAPIKSSLLAKDYAVQLASRLQAREEDVLEALSKLKPVRARTDDEPGQPVAPAHAEERLGDAQPFTESELNRRRFEREMLSVASQFPQLALEHADDIAQTQWHEPSHAALAEALLDVLAENPNASAAAIVSAASVRAPRAAGALTSAHVEETDAPALLSYVAEELAIGDMESSISALKSQLRNSSTMPADERELIFESIVGLQKALVSKREEHKLSNAPRWCSCLEES